MEEGEGEELPEQGSGGTQEAKKAAREERRERSVEHTEKEKNDVCSMGGNERRSSWRGGQGNGRRGRG